MKRITFLRIVLPVIILLWFAPGCQNSNTQTLPTPPEYNLNRPSVVKLPAFLDEISGIAYYGKDKSAFAICDEKGILYKIALTGKMAIERWKFGKNADYEDLVLIDSTFYALRSDGFVITIRFIAPDSAEVKEYGLPLAGTNEFEILYPDLKENRLIMLCKDCEMDNKSRLTAWAFDLQSNRFMEEPAYVMDVTKIAEMMGEKKVKFKPSAAGIHPLTGDLYIISSINNVLVIADQKGVPKRLFQINPSLYKQPEGLTFTPDGTLIITNESADIGAANILLFKYNQGR